MEELVHKGHRQRMRRKLADFGPRVFDTYELLEMLLYHTVPVKDTNPIAKRLLKRFGSLDGVLSADAASLCEVEGVGAKTAQMLTTAGMALDICIEEYSRNDDKPNISSYTELGEYLVSYYGGTERRSILFLTFDNKMQLLGVDELYEIDFSSGAVIPKPFLDTAVCRAASVAIIAHNHPYGPLCPTEGDRETNVLIRHALGNIGVCLAEHFIVSGDSYLGFMTHMESMFSQMPELGRFFEGKWGAQGV